MVKPLSESRMKTLDAIMGEVWGPKDGTVKAYGSGGGAHVALRKRASEEVEIFIEETEEDRISLSFSFNNIDDDGERGAHLGSVDIDIPIERLAGLEAFISQYRENRHRMEEEKKAAEKK